MPKMSPVIYYCMCMLLVYVLHINILSSRTYIINWRHTNVVSTPEELRMGTYPQGLAIIYPLSRTRICTHGHDRDPHGPRTMTVRVFSSTYGSVRCSHMHRTGPYMHRTVTVRVIATPSPKHRTEPVDTT